MSHMRDATAYSEHDDADLARLAAELYESEAFEADLTAAARDVLRNHVEASDALGADELDVAAEQAFEERLFKEGRGGLFMLRGALLTNAEADIQPRDVIKMAPSDRAESDDPSWFVVHAAAPGSHRIRAIKVDLEEETTSYYTPGHQAGHVVFNDRFEISRAHRDRDERPWSLARGLLEDLVEQREGGDAE